MKFSSPILLALTMGLAACTSDYGIQTPKPLQDYKQGPTSDHGSQQPGVSSSPAGLRVVTAPALPEYADVNIAAHRPDVPSMTGRQLQVNIDGMSLPAFINELYGNTLGLNFSLAPDLAARNDRVTLRATEPQDAETVYTLALQVLEQYGVAVEQRDNLLYFFVSGNRGAEPPLLVTGRALPDVPSTHRPVFAFVPLKAVRMGDVVGWLNMMYNGAGVRAEGDQKRNVLVLSGTESMVREALQAVAALDRPFMRGQRSLIVQPSFTDVDKLAARLVDVLTAEGYGATTNLQASGSIIVLPASEANQIVLFAEDPSLLDHAREWLQTMDQPAPGLGERLFFYKVKNTTAKGILRTIDALLGQVRTANVGASAGSSGNQAAGVSESTQLVVDEPRNTLIFRGEASRWQELLELIAQLDLPAKQVLIEVTIAEITLTEQENFGIDWLANGNRTDFGETFRFSPQEPGGSGLTAIVLDSIGQAKVTLNVFASDSRVQLLSTPRILVQSGETAKIDIGTEVPIITTASQGTTTDARITQSVQYRRTGVLLEVSPVVHSGNRVDLTVSQEVSEALPVSSSAAIQSPSIFNRSIKTVLSLEDGGSVILGGLLSSRSTRLNNGVPWLKGVPFLGGLFRSEDGTIDRTEMVMLIIPYVIENDATAQSVTRALTRELDWLRP